VSKNTDNAIHGLQEARAAIFVETGGICEPEVSDELEQIEKLDNIQTMINKVESAIKEYANDN